MGADEQISVVMPVFNEAPVIERVVEDVVRDVLSIAGGGEIVVVDDCSTDETPAVLDRLCGRHEALRVLRNDDNVGHGPSVVRGLDEARNSWIFLVDSDAQFVMSEVASMWAVRDQADVVLGERRTRAGSRHRSVLGYLLSAVVSRLAGRRLPDPNIPFKLLRRSIWRELRPAIDDDARVPSVFIALGAALLGRRIVHVPVTHLPRTHAPSNLRGARLVRFSLASVRELFRFRRRMRSIVAARDDSERAERDSSSIA